MKNRDNPSQRVPTRVWTRVWDRARARSAVALLSATMFSASPGIAGAAQTRIRPLPDVAGDDLIAENAGTLAPRFEQARRNAQARLPGAVAYNYGNAVRNELALGADPRVVDESGRTPLHTAAALGALESARALLDEAVEGQPAKSGESAPASGVSLLDLSFDQTVRRLELLSAKDADGCTPLHLATRGGHYDMVDLLLGYAAEVDPVSTGGFTPLHLAAIRNDEAVIALLLSRGADPTARTRGGTAPGELATTPGAKRRVADAVTRIEHSPAWREARSLTERMLAAWRDGDADALRAVMASDTPGLHDIRLEPVAFDATIERISARGFEATTEGRLHAPTLDPLFEWQRFTVQLADTGDGWRITGVDLAPAEGGRP